MKPLSDFDLRIWDPANEDVIAALLDGAAETHGTPVQSRAWFRWKHAQSPHGPAVIAYAVDRETKRLAGNVSFGWQTMSVDGSEVRAAVSYETWVHPNYQRRGLFTALVRHAYQESTRRGALVWFNFPNLSSRAGFAKCGWQDLGGYRSWLLPGSYRPGSFNTLRRIRGLEMKPDIAHEVEHEIAHALDKVAELAYDLRRRRDGYSPDRTERYLDWRFASFRDHSYDVVSEKDGVVLYRTGLRGELREVQILDIFGDRPKTLRSVANDALEKSGADIATFSCARGHHTGNRLAAAGFLPVPNRGNFFGFSESSLPTTQKWSIAAADFHTY